MKKKIKFAFISLILIALTTPICSAESDVDIHGFISQGYLDSSDNNFQAPTNASTFEFNEFGINFGQELTDKLHLGMQIFSRDLGSYGNNETSLDWAYGDYRWKDWLGMRAGKIKTPHGLYNETRDVDILRNWIFLPQSVYPELTRDATLSLIGGGFYGNIDLNNIGTISYQLLGGTQNISANEALAQALMGITYNGTEVQNEAIDVKSKYVLGLEWGTPLDGLRVGGTYSKAEIDLTSVYDFTASATPEFGAGYYYTELDSDTYVVSVEYAWNNLLLVSEYTWSDRKVDFGTPYTNKLDGWYFGGTYRFTDWFELGGYYSEYYADRKNRDGDGIDAGGNQWNPKHRAFTKDTCLTTRFDVNEYFAIKLEAHALEGTAILSGIDNPVTGDASDQFTKSWNMFAAKITYSF
ncbi:MAG: hypothetical protein PVI90_03490 [Desulfobacteraceae bacterium]|jgi:hypothetical protein